MSLLQRTLLILLTLLLLVDGRTSAQQQKQNPSPSPSPTPVSQEPDRVRVFTEEVRLPIEAVDSYGHYDPSLEPDDVLVLEDGVAQQVRSITFCLFSTPVVN